MGSERGDTRKQPASSHLISKKTVRGRAYPGGAGRILRMRLESLKAGRGPTSGGAKSLDGGKTREESASFLKRKGAKKKVREWERERGNHFVFNNSTTSGGSTLSGTIGKNREREEEGLKDRTLAANLTALRGTSAGK